MTCLSILYKFLKWTNIFKVPTVTKKAVPEEKVPIAVPKKPEPTPVPKRPESPPSKGTLIA